MENNKEDYVTPQNIKQLIEENNLDKSSIDILPRILEKQPSEENEKKHFTEDEIEMIKRINLFNERVNRAYEQRYGKKDIEIRNYIATFDNIILTFFIGYKFSKYYKNTSKEDIEINNKIFEQLKNIVFEMYLIFEFELFDENPMFTENPKNEYEMLYNLNKTQNFIIKTRILWDKVMNFFYLLIERKEMKVKKSKKGKFVSWCKEKNISFFDETMNKLIVFDEKFRTGEVHEFSKLKSFFENGTKQNIYLYCLNLLLTFSNETIVNIMAYINDIKPNYKWWQKQSDDMTYQLEEFTQIPTWVKEIIKKEYRNKEIEDGSIISGFIN